MNHPHPEQNDPVLASLEHLRAHLHGKVVILGIGNALRNDDGIGTLLAGRIKNKVPYIVYDCSTSPENYLGKVIKDQPDNIIIIDALDSGVPAGELGVLENQQLEVANLFSTHNASLSLTINYLQSHLKVDIIILTIQPQSIAFGDKLSPQINAVLERLEEWFCAAGQKER